MSTPYSAKLLKALLAGENLTLRVEKGNQRYAMFTIYRWLLDHKIKIDKLGFPKEKTWCVSFPAVRVKGKMWCLVVYQGLGDYWIIQMLEAL